jgi:hypothetical protein
MHLNPWRLACVECEKEHTVCSAFPTVCIVKASIAVTDMFREVSRIVDWRSSWNNDKIVPGPVPLLD